MSHCGAFSLVGTDGHEAGVYALRCKSWGCSHCGPRKTKATIARVRQGMRQGPCKFITITSPAGESRDTTYAEFSGRWRRLHERIRRRFGTIEYVAVVEPQARGAAHVHVVFRGPFIPQRWLSRAAREAGFGSIVDIRRAPRTLATYLTKDLTKAISDPTIAPPRYFRRVRWSHHWSDWARPALARTWSSWYVVDAVPPHAAISAAQRGYTVVEVVGGVRARFDPGRVVIWLRNLRDLRVGR